MCDLIGSRDSTPSPRRRRHPTAATAAAAGDGRAAHKEKDEEDTTTCERGARHGAACGACRAPSVCGCAAAGRAAVDGADSADGTASLGRGKRVKKPTDKARMIENST